MARNESDVRHKSESKCDTQPGGLRSGSEAEGDLSQAEKFAQAARDLGADQDEDAFKGVLRKLAKPRK